MSRLGCALTVACFQLLAAPMSILNLCGGHCSHRAVMQSISYRLARILLQKSKKKCTAGSVLLSTRQSHASCECRFRLQDLRVPVHTGNQPESNRPPDGFGHFALVSRPQTRIFAVLDLPHIRHVFGHNAEILEQAQSAFCPGTSHSSRRRPKTYLVVVRRVDVQLIDHIIPRPGFLLDSPPLGHLYAAQVVGRINITNQPATSLLLLQSLAVGAASDVPDLFLLHLAVLRSLDVSDRLVGKCEGVSRWLRADGSGDGSWARLLALG